MKKQASTKKTTVKKTTRAAARNEIPRTSARTKFNPWSLSIYVYWFIILFFIAATFYILGRSHGILNQRQTDNVEITEEALIGGAQYYESGREKLLAGNVDEALADLNAAIAAENPTPEMYVLRGEAYMLSGNYAASESDFNRALEISPTSSMAFYDRALLHARMENYDMALDDINNAMAAAAQESNSVLAMRDLYAKRGQLNLWIKNWDGAIADYTNSLARPDGMVNYNVYAERAEAYTAVGQYSSAIEDYASAIRVISEQIQGKYTAEERESLSSRAMSYFERSAALNVQIGNGTAAMSDLDSARTIAVALGDNDSVLRIDGLMSSLAE
ncbi:MAG: tetratricopeptide repeat protein [Alphaproteobacteria bacterium]|nr:tetratricopeptide repeat protein [Alphaproteobacteria bacterium]